MITQKTLTARYTTIIRVVLAHHAERDAIGKGHDYYHALRVAECARQIARSADVAELAWVAGILHNTDHLFGPESQAKMTSRLYAYLATTKLSSMDCELVIDAVLKHNQRNVPTDSDVLVTLKDADKVVNMEADVIMRSAQFRQALPTFDPRFVLTMDPEATYKNPKTVYGDLRRVLEWVDEPGWFRNENALAMAQERATFIRLFLATWAGQLQASGMLAPEYPLELIPEALG